MHASKKFLLFPLRLFYDNIFNPVYKKRLAENIVPLCEAHSNILDVGCGDGSVAKLIMDSNPSLNIAGIEIQSSLPAKIPRKLYNGKEIPYPDNHFDIVIALDVLHHIDDIPSLLAEMERVSKKYLIIKDHMTYSIFSQWLISFTDYFSNLPYGIRCAFNFPSFERWKSYFDEGKTRKKRLRSGYELVTFKRNRVTVEKLRAMPSINGRMKRQLRRG